MELIMENFRDMMRFYFEHRQMLDEGEQDYNRSACGLIREFKTSLMEFIEHRRMIDFINAAWCMQDIERTYLGDKDE